MRPVPLFCAFGLVPAMALAAFSLPAGAAVTDEHTYTLISVDTAAAEFADDAARRNRDGSITMAILRVPDGGPIAYSSYQLMLNCAAKKSQQLSGVNFSRDGHQSPIEGEAAASPIQPGTLGQVLQRYICEGVDPYPRSKTIKSLDDALSRARELIAAEKNK